MMRPYRRVSSPFTGSYKPMAPVDRLLVLCLCVGGLLWVIALVDDYVHAKRKAGK